MLILSSEKLSWQSAKLLETESIGEIIENLSGSVRECSKSFIKLLFIFICLYHIYIYFLNEQIYNFNINQALFLNL